MATCGLISFGHAGLLGVGCYVFAGVTVLMGGSPNLAFPAAIVAGACVAFMVGLFAVRTTGAFFIMVTLAAAEMLFSWGYRSPTFGGANGMGGVPRLDLTAIGIDLNDPQRVCPDDDRAVHRHLAAAGTGGVLALRAHARRHPAESEPGRGARRARVLLSAGGLYGLWRDCRAWPAR